MILEIEAGTVDAAPLYTAMQDGTLLSVTISLAGVTVAQTMRIARIREREGVVWRDRSRISTRVPVIALLLEQE